MKILIVLAFVTFLAVLNFILMLCVNYVASGFGLNEITYFQTLALWFVVGTMSAAGSQV